MASKCGGSIRDAMAGRGEKTPLTDAEIDDMIVRLTNRHLRKMGENPGMSRAQAWKAAGLELTREQMRANLIAERLRLASARSTAFRTDLIRRLGRRRMNAVNTLNVGDERVRKVGLEEMAQGSEEVGSGGGNSVDARGVAQTAELWGDIEKGLKKIDGAWDMMTSLWTGGQKELEDAIVHEMARQNNAPGLEPHENKLAGEIATVLNAALEKSRQMQNQHGAYIGHIDGYFGRQLHDSIKVSGGFWGRLANLDVVQRLGWTAAKDFLLEQSFREWRTFIEPRLADVTFEGVGGTAGDDLLGDDLPINLPMKPEADAKGRFLQRIWWDIVQSDHTVITGADDRADFRPAGGNKAKAVSAERVLHFKSHVEGLEYHRKYGRGTIMERVLEDTARGARNAALMEMWGPNPDQAFEEELSKMRLTAGERATLKRGFEEINGRANVPENMRFALVGRMLRVHQVLTKLGGMVWSALSDMPISAQTQARMGIKWLDGYSGVIEGLRRSTNSVHVSEMLDVSARSAMAKVASRFGAADGFAGWMGRAQRNFYAVQGMEFWNDGVRAGTATGLSLHMGRNADKTWANIDQGLREQLDRFAIDKNGWDLLRRGVTEFDGKPFVMFDALDDAGAVDIARWAGLKGKAMTLQNVERARADLKLRYQALVHDLTDSAVSEARAREHAFIHGRVKPGSILGEFALSFSQFWAFPQALITRQLVPAMGGYAGQGTMMLMAHLLLATTLFGYLSLQAKQLIKLREPRPLMNEDGTPNLELFMASFVQGGGAGIYGDFLFGEHNRYGGTIQGTIGGPLLSTGDRLFQMFTKLRNADEDHPADLGAEGTRFVIDQIPFVNLWWTRAALDYALLWRINEATNPGWAMRYEQRVEKDTGAGFIVHPMDHAY